MPSPAISSWGKCHQRALIALGSSDHAIVLACGSVEDATIVPTGIFVITVPSPTRRLISVAILPAAGRTRGRNLAVGGSIPAPARALVGGAILPAAEERAVGTLSSTARSHARLERWSASRSCQNPRELDPQELDPQELAAATSSSPVRLRRQFDAWLISRSCPRAERLTVATLRLPRWWSAVSRGAAPLLSRED